MVVAHYRRLLLGVVDGCWLARLTGWQYIADVCCRLLLFLLLVVVWLRSCALVAVVGSCWLLIETMSAVAVVVA